MKRYSLLVALLISVAGSASAQTRELTVMISGGFKAAWDQLSPRYAAREGIRINTVAGPSMGKTPQAIPNRLARGEKADVVIMVGDALTSLEKAGRTAPGSRTELADSPIGMVVKQGAPVPAINTPDALRQTLLQARSIAYSDSASGRYVSTTLFKKLGIEAQVETRARMVERIPVASEVAKGKYAVGFQQVSELLPEPGVTFVGELPDSVQYITRFAGAVTNNAAHAAEGRALLAFLASPDAQKVVRATGMRSVAQKAPVRLADTVQ